VCGARHAQGKRLFSFSGRRPRRADGSPRTWLLEHLGQTLSDRVFVQRRARDRDRVQLSVLVLTFNEEPNIRLCLETVAGWCEEIHVVDSGSTDSTVMLAKQFTDLVHYHPYVDHSSQLNWALCHLQFCTEWLLVLDADHRVTERLRDQIATVVAVNNRAVDGYYTAHRYIFAGGLIRGFKPWVLRLVRHANATVDQSELVDFRFKLRGDTGYLSGVVIEHNEKERDIDFWIDKHQKYATRLAAEHVLRTSGMIRWSVRPTLFGDHDQRIVWLKQRWQRMPLLVRPFLYFGYRYVFQLGILDGKVGLIYHVLQAFWYRMVIDVKIMQINEQVRRGELSLTELARELDALG